MISSLPVDAKGQVRFEEEPLFKRYVGFALLEQEYYRSDAFAAVCNRVQQAQRDQAMLLSNRPTPNKQQNWVQEELTSKILPGMQGIQQSVTSGLTVCRAIGKGVCVQNH
jgi:hypothetical protein